MCGGSSNDTCASSLAIGKGRVLEAGDLEIVGPHEYRKFYKVRVSLVGRRERDQRPARPGWSSEYCLENGSLLCGASCQLAVLSGNHGLLEGWQASLGLSRRHHGATCGAMHQLPTPVDTRRLHHEFGRSVRPPGLRHRHRTLATNPSDVLEWSIHSSAVLHPPSSPYHSASSRFGGVWADMSGSLQV